MKHSNQGGIRNRRSILRTIGGLMTIGALAGCLGAPASTDGNDGAGGDDGNSNTDGGNGANGAGGSGGGGDEGPIEPPAEVDDYLAETPNYDGELVDQTGQSTARVDVGAGDGYVFAPPAIAVDAGTTVVWEWTGQGGIHDVTDVDGNFGSEMLSEAGTTFEHTFEESGVSRYVCKPHETMEMKGTVVVR